MTRKRAVGAGKSPAPKRRSRSTAKRKRSGATGFARHAAGATRHIRGRVNALRNIGYADILKYGLILLGAVFGYGKMESRVESMSKEQERQGRMVDAIYQRSLFQESGRSGPDIPVPDK